MHVQHDAGCLLVRDGEAHRKSFSTGSAYLRRASRGLAGVGEWPSDLGTELSRGFRALKIWFAPKRTQQKLVGRSHRKKLPSGDVPGCPRPALAGCAADVLSVAKYRVLPLPSPGWDEASLDRLNEDVVGDLQESGVAAPSTTRILGALVIRANLTNHRTCQKDLDLLIRAASDAAHRRIAAG